MAILYNDSPPDDEGPEADPFENLEIDAFTPPAFHPILAEDCVQGLNPFLVAALETQIDAADECGHRMGNPMPLGVGLWLTSQCRNPLCTAFLAVGAREGDFLIRLHDYATPTGEDSRADDCPYPSGDSLAALREWARGVDWDTEEALLYRTAADRARQAGPDSDFSALMEQYIEEALEGEPLTPPEPPGDFLEYVE